MSFFIDFVWINIDKSRSETTFIFTTIIKYRHLSIIDDKRDTHLKVNYLGQSNIPNINMI